jgi:hypothetical protein
MYLKIASQSQASKTKKPQIARVITDQESGYPIRRFRANLWLLISNSFLD